MPCSSLRTRQNMTESSYFFYIHDVPLKKLYLLKPKFCLKKILFLKSILFLVSEKVAGKNIWVTFYKFNFFFNYFFKVYLQRLLHICITHICLYLFMFLFIYASTWDIALVEYEVSYMNSEPKNFLFLFIFALSSYRSHCDEKNKK